MIDPVTGLESGGGHPFCAEVNTDRKCGFFEDRNGAGGKDAGDADGAAPAPVREGDS